jgi:hypothetical protein
VIERRQLKQWFPHDDILLASTKALDGRVSDPGARAMLLDTGVPETFLEVLEFDRHLSSGVQTLEEVYREEGSAAPPGTGALLFLGYAGQAFLALDGTTGEVRQVHTDIGERPFAPSLEAFVRALGAISEDQRGKGKVAPTVDHLLTVVAGEIGGGTGAAEPAWRMFLADVAGYLSDQD